MGDLIFCIFAFMKKLYHLWITSPYGSGIVESSTDKEALELRGWALTYGQKAAYQVGELKPLGLWSY